MPKAVAVAIKNHPLSMAMKSASNAAFKLCDFMYGNEEKTKYTLAFAFGLLVLGIMISPGAPDAMAVCAQ